MDISKLSVPGAQTPIASTGTLAKVAGAKGITMERIEATAKEFEAQFISQMLESMFSTTDAKESLGGSEAEETYQSLMIEEYGKVISRSGGIGISDQIKRAMLQMQEASHVKTPVA